MSLEVDGVWKGGLWASTVWASGVWREGDPTIVFRPKFLFSDVKTKLTSDLISPSLTSDIKTILTSEV